MPRLACWTCGRRLYATAALEALFPDERRCAKCGTLLNLDRRTEDRRRFDRRVNPPNDPGPPGTGERRVEQRRKGQRRQNQG